MIGLLESVLKFREIKKGAVVTNKIDDDEFPKEHGAVVIGAVGGSPIFMESTGERVDRTVAGKKREMLVLDLEGQEWKNDFVILQAGGVVPNLKRP